MKEDERKVKPMIVERIEELRLQMHNIAQEKDLTDPRVVSISEKLDQLIKDYYFAQVG